MTVLVFLEHHGGQLEKGPLGVLTKAATLGDDVAGVLVGSGVRDLASEAGKFGAGKVFVWDDASVEAPLPQPRVDALASLVEQERFETVLFAGSVLAADVAAGLAARLEAGINWDLIDLDLRDDQPVGLQPVRPLRKST